MLGTGEIGFGFGGEATYDPPIDLSKLMSTPEVLAIATYLNDSDGEDTVEFIETNTKSANFSTSFTEGVKVGAETTFKTGIPFIASAQVKLSAEVSFSSTQTTESSTAQEWKVDTTLTIPARSKIVATMEIDTFTYQGQVNAKVVVGGRLFINFATDHLRATMPEVLRAVQAQLPGVFTYTDATGRTFRLTDEDVARFSFDKNGNVLFAGSGEIHGAFGTRLKVVKKQYAIDDITIGDRRHPGAP